MAFPHFFKQRQHSPLLSSVHADRHPDIALNSRKSFLRFSIPGTVGVMLDEKESPEGQPAPFEEEQCVRRLREFRINSG